MTAWSSAELFAESSYPNLHKYTTRMSRSVRPVLNREDEIDGIRANLARPEYTNILLLGEAGVGKTAIVEHLSGLPDFESHIFLEVELARMADTSNPNIVASRIKGLVDEVMAYQSLSTSTTLVLFMDEFHQLVTLSPAAIEALKPLLARSGTYRVRIITATTFEEYQQHIQGNEALNQRLQRINVRPPNRDTVIQILKSVKQRSAPTVAIDDSVYYAIVDMTDKYMPSQMQPRKSILVLDAMIGWHRAHNRAMNHELLSHVIYQSTNIKSWDIDVESLASYLEQHVKGQPIAIEQVTKRLYMSLARLVDDTKPQASFLFTGSTGVGKTELAKRMAIALFGDERALIRFDMSEYVQESSVDLFRERLTDKVWESPYAIVLLDEIEKANGAVTRLLLQVLDDARLTNRYGRETSFVNTYMILTTNVGAEVFSTAAAYTNEHEIAEYQKRLLGTLRTDNVFPSELVNRFDTVVPFAPLGRNGLDMIASMTLLKLKERVFVQHGVRVLVDSRVLDYLIYEHADPDDIHAGGGRGIKRIIDSDITAKIARFVVHNPGVKEIRVGVSGTLRKDSLTQLVSQASITITKVEYGANATRTQTTQGLSRQPSRMVRPQVTPQIPVKGTGSPKTISLQNGGTLS